MTYVTNSMKLSIHTHRCGIQRLVPKPYVQLSPHTAFPSTIKSKSITNDDLSPLPSFTSYPLQDVKEIGGR